jgi:hypothetical protein
VQTQVHFYGEMSYGDVAHQIDTLYSALLSNVTDEKKLIGASTMTLILLQEMREKLSEKTKEVQLQNE